MVPLSGQDDNDAGLVGAFGDGAFLGGLSDAVIRRLRPRWVRSRTAAFLSRYERFGPVDWCDLPEGRRLCVVAPHPDDESIGCGGLIARWTRAGRPADVTFLTAGEAGDRRLRQQGLSSDHAAAIRAEVAAWRRAEAGAALALLGAVGYWLDGTDGGLHAEVDRLADALAGAWSDAPPDLVAVPFPADRHPDHAMAARIVASALARADTDACVLGYEVWSPAPVNMLLPIDAVADLKWSAISAHRSQVATTDYLAAAQGLNRYRAISGGRSGFAEGYFRADRKTFTSMTNALRV